MIFQWESITYLHIEHQAVPATKPSEKRKAVSHIILDPI